MRFELEPLLEQMRERSPDMARRRLGIGGQTFKKLLEEGLTEEQADHFATRAGFHAAAVWPEWFNEGAVRSVVEHECSACGRGQFEVERLPTVRNDHGAVVQFGSVLMCAEGHMEDFVVSLLPHVPSGEEGANSSEESGASPSSPLDLAGSISA